MSLEFKRHLGRYPAPISGEFSSESELLSNNRVLQNPPKSLIVEMSVNYAIYLAIRIIFSQSHFNLLTLKISKSIKICQTEHYSGSYRLDHFFLTEMSKYQPF